MGVRPAIRAILCQHDQLAQAVINKLKSTKEYVSPTELAVLYIGLGNKEEALSSLEKAYAHDPQMQTLKVDPHLTACAQIRASRTWYAKSACPSDLEVRSQSSSLICANSL